MSGPTWESTTDVPAATQASAPATDTPTWEGTTDPGSFGQQAKNLAENVANSATLGLSTLAETAHGPVHGHGVAMPDVGPIATPEAIQARQEENPIGTDIGQLGGGVLFGEGSGIVKGVEAAAGATTAVGKALARAAGMGLEGGAFGAGNAVTDYALGDPNLNAQKILGDVTMGAALGSGLGVLSRGVETLLPAATAKVSKALSSLGDHVSGMVEGMTGDWVQALKTGLSTAGDPEQYIRDTVSNIGDIHKVSDDAAEELYNDVLKPNLKTALVDRPLQDVQDSAWTVLKNAQDRLEHMTNNPSEYSPAQVKQFAQVVSDLTEKFDNADNSYDLHEALHDFAKDSSKGIKYDKLPPFSQQAVQSELRDINVSVRNFLKNPEVWGEFAAGHYTEVSDAYSAMKTARKNVESDLMTKEYTPTGAKKVIPSPSKISTLFNNAGDVSQDLRSAHLNAFLNSVQNMANIIKNSAGFRNAVSAITDRVNQLAKKHSELAEIAKIMNNRIGGMPGTMKELGGIGAAHMLGASNPVIASALAGLEAYKAIKNPYKLGVTLNSAFTKLKAIGNITKAVGDKTNSAIKSIFSGAGGAGITSVVTHGENYEQKVDKINNLSNDPQVLMEHLEKSTGAMYDAAPNISQGIHNTMTAAVNFLKTKIPAPGPQFPMSEEWEPSQVQKDQFLDYYTTVNDPLSTLDSIKDGTLNNRQVEALQAVYPHMLTDLRSKLTQDLHKGKDSDMSYASKIALAKFIGTPMDANMTVPSMAVNQMALQPPQPSQTPQGGAKAPKSTLGGLKELDVGQRARTQSQTLAEEES
jgi:hypothetical protein